MKKLSITLRITLLWTLLGLMFPTGGMARAETLFVVVNPNAEVEELTRSEVINIYMGRNQKLSRNQVALPLDIASDHKEKADFYRTLIHRDLPEVNSYWVRVMFSGEASPPRQVDNYEQIRAIVKENQGAIAYVSESQLKNFQPDDYKIVYVLGD